MDVDKVILLPVRGCETARGPPAAVSGGSDEAPQSPPALQARAPAGEAGASAVT